MKRLINRSEDPEYYAACGQGHEFTFQQMDLDNIVYGTSTSYLVICVECHCDVWLDSLLVWEDNKINLTKSENIMAYLYKD